MAARQKSAKEKPRKRAPLRGKGRPAAAEAKVGSARVIDTARLLLRQVRPAQITRAEVAKAAGIDPKLVRYYFENYDDLLDEVVDLSIRDLHDTMERASRRQASAAVTIRERLKALIDFLAENPTFFKLLVDRVYSGAGTAAREKLEELTRRAYARHQEVIRLGRDSGEFRQDFDPRLLYVAVIGMAEFFVTGRAVIELLFGQNAEAVRARYEKFVFDLVIRGIGAG